MHESTFADLAVFMPPLACAQFHLVLFDCHVPGISKDVLRDILFPEGITRLVNFCIDRSLYY